MHFPQGKKTLGLELAEPRAGETQWSEKDIANELSGVWRDKRWWIAPEGAACLAALPQLLERGLVKRGERVVAVNTGSLEKYLPTLRHLLG